jgi:hypothetical protein
VATALHLLGDGLGESGSCNEVERIRAFTFVFTSANNSWKRSTNTINSSLVYITIIMDMDFEQGGDALAIFQEAFNAQQHPAAPVENDRKMLYVHPSSRSLYSFSNRM